VELRVLTFNLGQRGWRQLGGLLVELAMDVRADVVVATELHVPRGRRVLQLDDAYDTFYAPMAQRGRRGGVAVLVRHCRDIFAERLEWAPGGEWLLVRVRHAWAGRPLFVFGAYLAVPRQGDSARQRARAAAVFDELAGRAAAYAARGAVICIGDLNAWVHPWAPETNARGRRLLDAMQAVDPPLVVCGPEQPTCHPTNGRSAAIDLVLAPTDQLCDVGRPQLLPRSLAPAPRGCQADHSVVLTHVAVGHVGDAPQYDTALRPCSRARRPGFTAWDSEKRDRCRAILDAIWRPDAAEGPNQAAERFEAAVLAARRASGLDRVPKASAIAARRELSTVQRKFRNMAARIRAATSPAQAASLRRRRNELSRRKKALARELHRRVQSQHSNQLRRAGSQHVMVVVRVLDHLLHTGSGRACPPPIGGHPAPEAQLGFLDAGIRERYLRSHGRVAGEEASTGVPPALRVDSQRALRRQRADRLHARVASGRLALDGALDTAVTPGEVMAARVSLNAQSATRGALTTADLKYVDKMPGRPATPGRVDAKIAAMLTAVLHRGPVPDDWCRSLVRAMYKGKGQRDAFRSWRLLALSSAQARLWQQVVAARLLGWAEAEHLLPDGVAAMRHGRSTEDLLMINATVTARAYAARDELHALYLDFAQAYPSVNHDVLLNLIYEMGVDGPLWLRLHETYNACALYAEVDGWACLDIPMRRGLREGDAVSCILFLLYMLVFHNSLQQLAQRGAGFSIAGWGRWLVGAFVDDNKLNLAGRAFLRTVESALTALARLLHLSINLNPGKTASASLVRPRQRDGEQLRWRLSGQPVRVVDEVLDGETAPTQLGYKYLGMWEQLQGTLATWNAQYRLVCTIARANLKILHRLGLCMVGITAGTQLWGDITQKFTYASGIWAYEPDAPCAAPLRTLEVYAARQVLRLRSNTSTPGAAVLLLLGWTTIAELHQRHRLRLLVRILRRPPDDAMRLALHADLLGWLADQRAMDRKQSWWDATYTLLRKIGVADAVVGWYRHHAGPGAQPYSHEAEAVGGQHIDGWYHTLERSCRQALLDQVRNLPSLHAMVPLYELLHRLRAPRGGSSRVAAWRCRLPALQVENATPAELGIYGRLWCCYRGMWGQVPRELRRCPLCVAAAAAADGGPEAPALTVPHVIRDCPQLDHARAACWAGLRHELRDVGSVAGVFDGELPPPGDRRRNDLLHVVLGMPPLDSPHAWGAAEWSRRLTLPSSEWVAPGRPFDPFAGAFRVARAYARHARTAAAAAFPGDVEWSTCLRSLSLEVPGRARRPRPRAGVAGR